MTAPMIAPPIHLSVINELRDPMVDYLVMTYPHLGRTHAEKMIGQLKTRLVNRLVEDYAHLDVDEDLAHRILNEAFGFLKLCAKHSGYGPAKLPDLGWHAFLMYTMEYEAFCHALAGHMMHHCPTDVSNTDATDSMARQVDEIFPDGTCVGGHRLDSKVVPTIADTVAALKREFGMVDRTLWGKLDNGSCSAPFYSSPPCQGSCNKCNG